MIKFCGVLPADLWILESCGEKMSFLVTHFRVNWIENLQNAMLYFQDSSILTLMRHCFGDVWNPCMARNILKHLMVHQPEQSHLHSIL